MKLHCIMRIHYIIITNREMKICYTTGLHHMMRPHPTSRNEITATFCRLPTKTKLSTQSVST